MINPKHEPRVNTTAAENELLENDELDLETSDQPMTPEWWNDLYTDGSGNCFSDADSGL